MLLDEWKLQQIITRYTAHDRYTPCACMFSDTCYNKWHTYQVCNSSYDVRINSVFSLRNSKLITANVSWNWPKLKCQTINPTSDLYKSRLDFCLYLLPLWKKIYIHVYHNYNQQNDSIKHCRCQHSKGDMFNVFNKLHINSRTTILVYLGFNTLEWIVLLLNE